MPKEKSEYKGRLSEEDLQKIAGGHAYHTGAECPYCHGLNTKCINLEGMGWTWVCKDCNNYWQE